MAASLDKLAANLSEFEEISSFYQEDQLQLLLRKGVYPYNYVNSLEKLQEKRADFHPKKPSTLSLMMKTFPTKTINMLKKYGILSTSRP